MEATYLGEIMTVADWGLGGSFGIVYKAIEPWVYEWIQKRQGSISAEHGLGVAKREFIGYSQNETMVKLMKQLKNLYDPVSCLSPLLGNYC